jgi:hypothetical protein
MESPPHLSPPLAIVATTGTTHPLPTPPTDPPLVVISATGILHAPRIGPPPSSKPAAPLPFPPESIPAIAPDLIRLGSVPTTLLLPNFPPITRFVPLARSPPSLCDAVSDVCRRFRGKDLPTSWAFGGDSFRRAPSVCGYTSTMNGAMSPPLLGGNHRPIIAALRNSSCPWLVNFGDRRKTPTIYVGLASLGSIDNRKICIVRSPHSLARM